jgi:hypothetical protein
MIRQTEIERYLDDWLGNAPMAPADRVVVSVAVRIGRQKQRPAPRIAWALADLAGSTRVLAGAAAAVLVAVVGLAVALSRPPGFGGIPTIPPTPAATEAPSASPSEPPPGIGVSFEGGVPSNWTIAASGLLSFSTAADGRSMAIELLPNRSVMSATCAMGPEPGVGTTADAFIHALATRPGLIAANEGPAEVGGQPGRQIDLRVDASVPPSCPGDVGPDDDFVPLFGVDVDGYWHHVGAVGTETYRLIMIDVPGGQNVLIGILGSDRQAFDQYIDDAMTIVSRLRFDFG